MFAQLRTGLRILTEIFRQSYRISPTYRLRELIMKLNNNNHVSKCDLHNFCGNPTPVIRSKQFYYCTARNPGTEQTTLSFGSTACSVGLTSHGFTQPTGQYPVRARFSFFLYIFDCLLFVYLLLFMHRAMCNIIWHLRICTCCLFKRKIELNH